MPTESEMFPAPFFIPIYSAHKKTTGPGDQWLCKFTLLDNVPQLTDH